jgi:hypothetical protein
MTGPWGLLDASGGVQEFTEDGTPFGDRFVRGSAVGMLGWIDWQDPIDSYELNTSDVRIASIGVGLRLASIVPAPSATAIAFIVAQTVIYRRNRRSR